MTADPPPARTRSARLTLVSLLLIPLVSLTALWGFAASITLGNFIEDRNYNTVANVFTQIVPTLQFTVQTERTATLVWLGSDRRSTQARAELLAARQATDKDAPAVSGAIESLRGLLNARETPSFDTVIADLRNIGQIRAAVDSGAYSQAAAFNAYKAISTAVFASLQASTPPGDANLSLMTQASTAAAQAQDSISGAVGLIEGALAARGLMAPAERVAFVQTVGQQDLEINNMDALSIPPQTVLYHGVFDTPAFQRLKAIESQVEASPANRPIPVNPATLQTTIQAIQAEQLASLPQIGVQDSQESAHLRNSLLTQLLLATVGGLIAIIASIVTARFSYRLRVELTGLYESARQMANERLPRLVQRLRQGEDVDVQAESPPLRAGKITEIANVAQAFSSVQRTAAEAAVGQASLRKGVNRVFVNLSMRNQSLLHRQLSMLDTMERATSDPAMLADLFRLDHVTTRMRRHAEALLILAGATPGRSWRDPVPVFDVLQAAIAEVEDYVRVDVITESTDAMTGPAVNDVIHLMAELIENATAFSPPNTRVTVTGDVVGRGFAAEVEDRGLGMPPEEMTAINQRLANPPEFDLANSEELGLFVASKLAARHGIRVSLRPSPYGGTTAVVVLPWEIIVPAHEVDPMSGPGSTIGLSAAAAGGSAHKAGPASSRDRGSAFGVTGRHQLREADSAPSMPVPTPPAQGQPGHSEPESAPAPAESPMAAPAGWAFESAGISTLTGPAGATRPTGVFGSSGATGSGPGLAADGAVSGGTYLGLPRRVRLASLAPQLRRQSSGEPFDSRPPNQAFALPAHSPEAAQSSAPPPEETSSRMSALQDGWLRGRLDDLDHPGAGSDPGGWPGGASAGEWESNDREVES